MDQSSVVLDRAIPAPPAFVAPVVYVRPSFEALERDHFASVDTRYVGRGWKFVAISCCKSVSCESRDVTFEHVHMGRNAMTSTVLIGMSRKGLRPALYEELLGFAQKYPFEQRKYDIVALGSVVLVDSVLHVAMLSMDGIRCRLTMRTLERKRHHLSPSEEGDDCRFLAVREQCP